MGDLCKLHLDHIKAYTCLLTEIWTPGYNIIYETTVQDTRNPLCHSHMHSPTTPSIRGRDCFDKDLSWRITSFKIQCLAITISA
jgi:hypothetical protein